MSYADEFENRFERLKILHEIVETTDYSSKRAPTAVSSEFTINDLMGSWAERLIYSSLDDPNLGNYRPVMYGRSDQLIAGQDGFAELWQDHMTELDNIGKRPDILVYLESKARDLFGDTTDISDNQKFWDEVSHANAGLEVRSSKQNITVNNNYKRKVLADTIELTKLQIDSLFQQITEKYPEFQKLIQLLNWMRNIDFDDFHTVPRKLTISRTIKERQIIDLYSEVFGNLKKILSILSSYRSFTVKVEDLEITNRWIQKYGVPHFYVQVFDDCAYMIPTMKILEIILDEEKKGSSWKLEKHKKNQMKSTFYVNLNQGHLIGRVVESPEYSPVKIQLDDGRLIFAVDFRGGVLELDQQKFVQLL